MNLLFDLATAFGLSTSAGLNAYIPLLSIALLAKVDDLGGPELIRLSSPWDALEHPIAIGVLLVLLLIEIFADKIPAVNHANDVIQTFVRPAAGVIAFAASTGKAGVHPLVAVVCGLILAGGVHAVKSVVVRPAVTVTTGGTANPLVSTAEDVVAAGVSVVAIVWPVVMAVLILILLAIILWLLLRQSAPAPSRG
jgi:hypothetical protein